MDISLRPAQPADAPEISRIYAASWRSAYRGMVPQEYLDQLKDKNDRWAERFRRDLGQGTLCAEMLFKGETPVGCAAYGKSRDDRLPDWGEIVSIYLHPDFYRKGYGTVLFHAVVEKLRAQGYPGCFLWVLDKNLNAQRFYEKNGFTRTQDICHSEILGEQLTEIRYQLKFNT
jgi:RimJ/RimL family protein N-acetyltransferase